MQGVRRDFMDMPECAVQKLFVMRCQMHVWRNLVYSQPRNIFVKRDVKLTEPPDAEPHVRWCERSAAEAASYSIDGESVMTAEYRPVEYWKDYDVVNNPDKFQLYMDGKEIK